MFPISCSFVSYNGIFRSVRFPFSAALPFGSCIMYRSVLFRLCARLHHGAEIVGRASHSASGATPTFKKASRGFYS